MDGLAADRFVYAGYSAGPCVLARRAWLDWTCATRPRTVKPPMTMSGFDGLGILDRPVVPHSSSPGHPETQLLSQVAARYEADDQPYWPLSDGQALVIDGTSVESSVTDPREPVPPR